MIKRVYKYSVKSAMETASEKASDFFVNSQLFKENQKEIKTSMNNEKDAIKFKELIKKYNGNIVDYKNLTYNFEVEVKNIASQTYFGHTKIKLGEYNAKVQALFNLLAHFNENEPIKNEPAKETDNFLKTYKKINLLKNSGYKESNMLPANR